MNLNASDRKKLLSLPFYMQKRQEVPLPQRGQPEFELFKQITGQDLHDDA